MRGMGRSGLIVYQLLGIAVVRGDEHLSAYFKQRVDNSAHTLVHNLDCLDRSRLHARMADHIGIGEVCDNHVVFSGFDRLDESVADLRRAHLRLQVISRNLGTLDQDPVLTRVRLLHAAVEEEGDMGIFLRLGDSGLGHIVGGKEFSEGIGDLDLRESDLLVGNGYVIVCEAAVEDLLARSSVKLVELVHAEASGDLSCAVRPEVEENDGIAVLNGADWFAVFHGNRRNDKFIRNAVRIGILYSVNAARCGNAFAQGKRPVSLLDTVPAVVAVHRVIAARNNADLADAQLIHLILESLHILNAGLGRRIAPVKEAVYEYIFDSFALCHLQKGINVGIVAVHAAVRQQSVHMQGAVVLFDIFHRPEENFVPEEISVLDLLADPGQVLINDSSRAHIQVSDLGVAHLSLRQADIMAARLSRYKRTLFHQPVHDRFVRQGDCIMVCARIQAISIENHQNGRFFTHLSLISSLSAAGPESSPEDRIFPVSSRVRHTEYPDLLQNSSLRICPASGI